MASLNEEAKELSRKYSDSSVVRRVRSLIDNLIDSFDSEEEQNPEHLSDGDLVVSPVELQLTNGTRIPAGHAFKFTEDLSKEIKSPLYTPTLEQVINLAKREELHYLILQHRNTPNDKEFYKLMFNRLKELNSNTIS